MMIETGVAADERVTISGTSSGEQTARSLPMKSLVAFFWSLIAIHSDGDAGAVLLREH